MILHKIAVRLGAAPALESAGTILQALGKLLRPCSEEVAALRSPALLPLTMARTSSESGIRAFSV
jgi:hypothetical protein